MNCKRQAKSGKTDCINEYIVMCELSPFSAEYSAVGNT